MRNLLLAMMFAALGCATGRMNQIDPLMHNYSGAVPGASVLVVREGRVVVRRSCGLANLEEHIAVTPATDYRLASMTKQFTAACILMLADRGKLSLDDPITKYLVIPSREDGEGSPSRRGSLAPLGMTLPAYANAITIRQLLTHTSGLLDYEDLIPHGTTKQLHDVDVLALLSKTDHTYFPPGTQYRYSNTGYAFLALIVERVSGQRFADFLRENIFEPAGMKNSVAFEEGISAVRNRAYGYSRESGGQAILPVASQSASSGPTGSGGQAGLPVLHWERTDQSLTSAVLGDGGIYTSIDDLVHWIAWLESGRFDRALVPATKTDEPGVQYGFGWRISEHRGLRYVWHSGETIGFRNAIVRFPEQHLSVVVLTNRDEGKPQEIALQIADMFLAP